MKIPIYEQHVDLNSPTPVNPENLFSKVNVQPSQFNAVENASVDLGKKLQETGAMLGEHAIRMKKQDDDKAVFDLDSKIQTDLNNVLYKQNYDANGAPITDDEQGLLMRQGDSAKNSLQTFDQRFSDLKDQYLSQAENNDQREKVESLLGRHYADFSDQVMKHEANERNAAYKDSMNSFLKATTDKASMWANNYKEPDLVYTQLDSTLKYAKEGMQNLGMDKNSIDLALSNLAGEYTKNAVSGTLEYNPARAREILEKNKDKILPDTAVQLNKVIEGREEYNTQLNYYNQKVIPLQNQFGGFDKTTAQNMIMNDSSMPVPKREKLWDYVKTRMAEAESNYKDFRAQSVDNLKVEIGQMKNQGGSNDQMLEQLAGKYASNSLEIAANKSIIKETIDKKAKLNLIPGTKDKLLTDIHNGTDNVLYLIDQAKANGSISNLEHSSLISTAKSGANPDYATARAQVDEVATKLYSSKKDKDKKQMFINMVIEQSGSDPNIMPAKAKELSEKAPASDWFRFSPGTNFEVNLQKQQEQRAQIKEASDTIGTDVVNAILTDGAKRRTNRQIDMSDLTAIRNTYPLEGETDAKKAIRELIRLGVPVTVRNIDAQMNPSKYPKK